MKNENEVSYEEAMDKAREEFEKTLHECMEKFECIG